MQFINKFIPEKKVIKNPFFLNKWYSSSSSSCRTAGADLSDPIPPPFSIVHHSRQVLKTTSCIGTELLYIGSSWLSCLCSSIWRSPPEYVTYEFVLTSPAVSRMSSSSNLDSFRDGWLVAAHLLFCRVLPPGLVKYCSQCSCVNAV